MSAKRNALDDPRTPMSIGLAQKLDALTDEEWGELTEWLNVRFGIEARKRQARTFTIESLAAAVEYSQRNLVLGAERYLTGTVPTWHVSAARIFAADDTLREGVQ